MQADGLRVESVRGDFYLNPVHAVEDPAQIGPVEAVLVAVKAWQVSEVASQIRPLVGQETIVIPLENGVEAPDQLIEALGRRPVLGGLCRITSFIAAPGHIRHTGIEPTVVFGELEGGDSPRAEPLLAAFARAGVNARVSAEIRREIWQKFLFIVAISGVGAVTRASIGVVRSLPATRALLEQVLEEVIAVARAGGVKLDETDKVQILQLIDGLPQDTIASMQRDILQGKPSELEYQTGTVVRLGAAFGVPVPANAFLYAVLLPQERLARGESPS
jgi:2-dehydropantoate 2-reductase